MGISRSSYYYTPGNSKEEWELGMIKMILDVMKESPFYGYRKITEEMNREEQIITLKQTRRLMRKMGLRALCPKKNLSKPRKGHKTYPYLLRGKTIYFPNQVWATDITYLKINGQSMSLVAILDLYSRKVLSWRLSNTMDVHFCLDTLDEAIRRYGIPAIFNTDQGSQFTSEAFTGMLESYGIEISMDGKGRALDNIYVERLWRSLKYEEIYLNCYESVEEMDLAISRYFHFYNEKRFHQSLEYKTPDEIYYSVFIPQKEAV